MKVLSSSGAPRKGRKWLSLGRKPEYLFETYGISLSYADYPKDRCNEDCARPWFLKILFLLTVGLGLLVCCLTLRYSTYSDAEFTMSEGDMILLPISTHFNKAIRIIGTSNTLDNSTLKLSVLSNYPSISKNFTSYQAAGRFSMASWSYQFWGMHLLEGSSVKISICADMQVQFYIIKSNRKMLQWTQQILYDEYDFHKALMPSQNCSSMASFKHHLLTVHESDNYYIMFASSVGFRFLTTITVALDFNRTYYDTSEMRYTCKVSDANCIANLTLASNDIALLELLPVVNEVSNPFRTIFVKWFPVARWDFYAKLFGSIFGAIALATMLYTSWRSVVNFKNRRKQGGKPFVVPCDDRMLASTILSRSTKTNRSSATTKTKDSWVVVRSLEANTSTEKLFEVRSHEGDSFNTTDSMDVYEGDTFESNESIFRRNREESGVNDDLMRNRMHYDDMQQLLDTCMTSAGVSAI